MHLKCQQVGTTTIFRLPRTVMGSDAWTLERALTAAVGQHNGDGSVLVDLGDTYRIDALGLQALIIGHGRGKGRLALVKPSPRVAELLRIVGLDRFFAIYPSETAALGIGEVAERAS